MTRKIVIIGAGGLAREVMDLIDAVNSVSPTYEMVGFVVEASYGRPGDLVGGKKILGDLDWFEGRQDQVEAICVVGAPELRRRLVLKAAALKVRFCSVVHPTAVISRRAGIGLGTVIQAGCLLSGEAQVRDHVYLNFHCTVAHDDVLEDFVILSPGAHLSGNVHVGEGTYIGTGASIIEKVTIGKWSRIGAGSTVLKDVRSNVTAFGVPSKEVWEREESWHLK
jgi:sugar O-acyltransferase (sialic acid O-acetyltransferase NeuD family)